MDGIARKHRLARTI